MDEGDSKNIQSNETKQNRYVENDINNVSNVFQSIWVRRAIQDCVGLDRFILENRYNFLFHFNTILFILFIFKFKK